MQWPLRDWRRPSDFAGCSCSSVPTDFSSEFQHFVWREAEEEAEAGGKDGEREREREEERERGREAEAEAKASR